MSHRRNFLGNLEKSILSVLSFLVRQRLLNQLFEFFVLAVHKCFEFFHFHLKSFDFFFHTFVVIMALCDDIVELFEGFIIEEVFLDFARPRSEDVESLLVLVVLYSSLLEVDTQIVHFMQKRIFSDQQRHQVIDRSFPAVKGSLSVDFLVSSTKIEVKVKVKQAEKF